MFASATSDPKEEEAVANVVTTEAAETVKPPRGAEATTKFSTSAVARLDGSMFPR